MKGILCFGDSITYGRGELPSLGWVGRLQKDFQDEDHKGVYNLGIPGDTSVGLKKRISVECELRCRRVHPSHYKVVIAIGMNDLKSSDDFKTQVSIGDFRKNVVDCIDFALEHADEVFLFGITTVNEMITMDWEGSAFTNTDILEYNRVLKEISSEKGIKFLDLFDSIEDIRGDLSDGLHPNSSGYDKMYARVKEFLL